MTGLILCLVNMIATSNAYCGLEHGYDESNVQRTVDAHNVFRSQLALGQFLTLNDTVKAPPASDMRKISWDCEIQKSAQAHADKNQLTCSGGHSGLHGLGENGYGLMTRAIVDEKRWAVNGSGVAAVEYWAREFKRHGTKNLSVQDGGIGHATQTAWALSEKIGCGYMTCKDRQLRKGVMMDITHMKMTCQYYPGGNFGGGPAYKVGPACSNCGEGYECESEQTGLCVKKQ